MQNDVNMYVLMLVTMVYENGSIGDSEFYISPILTSLRQASGQMFQAH